jgi:hypothetical protein
MGNVEAIMCSNAFLANWVAHFGVPATVTTDKATQLTSAIWTSTCAFLGIQHNLTTAYPPQSSRMVE